MVLLCRLYYCQSRHGNILRYLESPFYLLEKLVCIFLMVFMSYFLPIPGKTLLLIHLYLFHFRFHVAYFSPHLMGPICFLIFHISYLRMGDSSRLCRILFHLCHILRHLFRCESPHLRDLIFILCKFLFCLSLAIMPCLLCLLKFCMHLISRLSDLEAGIKYHLFRCIR